MSDMQWYAVMSLLLLILIDVAKTDFTRGVAFIALLIFLGASLWSTFKDRSSR